jgi:hypothetical protein
MSGCRASLGLGALLLACTSACAGANAAPESDRAALADLESQADYAFYTGDAGRAARIVADHEALAGATAPEARYQYAHAAFRWLQLAAIAHDEAGTQRAGRACLSTLEPVAEADPRAVEARALLSACAGYLALGGGLRGRTLAMRIEGWMSSAVALAPSNPRVRLTRGLLLWFQAAAAGDRIARARVDFEAAARALEAAGESEVDAGGPTWGGADAWLFVGHAAAAAGDTLAARTAYEKALFAVPEFGAARRALDALATRR